VLDSGPMSSDPTGTGIRGCPAMPRARTNSSKDRSTASPARLLVVMMLGLAALAVLLLATPRLARAEAATLAETRSQLAEAKAALRKRQAQLDELARAHEEAQGRLTATQDQIARVQAELETTEADLNTVDVQLQQRLRDMYKERAYGDLGIVEALFGAGESLVAVFNKVDVLNKVMERDRDFLDQVETHLVKQESLEAELQSRQAEEEQQVADLEVGRQNAISTLEATKDEYNRLQARVQKLEEEERRRKAEEEARRQAALAQAQNAKSSSSSGRTSKAAASSVGRAVSTSGWVFPVQGPNSFINSWGAARSGGRSHKGTDIMTPRNTPVVAVVSGTIGRTSPSDRGLGGITVWLNGSDGNSYYYAHLESIAGGVSRGTRVSAGQVIGYAGDTGNARGGETHLHFEIHPGGGSATNPYPTLVANR
jgi:murein DD-endopeptidase MepM/ murein hydrolase activator NlpD